MSFSDNGKISSRQLQILLLLDMLGTGLITLPSRICAVSGADAWLSVIISMIPAALIVCVITAVTSVFPGKSFFEYSSLLLTKPAGILISLGFAVRLLLLSAFELRFFGVLVNRALLRDTPFAVICAVMLCLSAYVSSKNYESRARLAEILVFIALLPFLALLLLSAFNVDYSNLLPLFDGSPRGIISGGLSAVPSFTPIELCLIAAPYISKPTKTRRSVIHLIIFAGLFMSAVTLITTARFGVNGVKRQLWPVFDMLGSVALPGGFIERQDAIVLSFWIISVFSVVSAGLFFSSVLIRDTLRDSGSRPKYAALCALAVFVLALPTRAAGLIAILNDALAAFYLVALPLILSFAALIKYPPKTRKTKGGDDS